MLKLRPARVKLPFSSSIFASTSSSLLHYKHLHTITFSYTMSSSPSQEIGEEFSGFESSSITSDHELEDFEESPRKRRKLSPPADAAKGARNEESRASADDMQTRVKAKKTGLIPSRTSKTSDSVDRVIQKREKSTFADLGVHPWLVSSLSALAITRPTGIQKACIPEILKGRDCIGGSRTGSGKTVAFTVPMFQAWAEDPMGIFGVILTPTRELALQIFEQVKAISAPMSLKAILVTGGADMREQAIALGQRPHVAIATPGRLADHIASSGEDTICGLRRVRFVVLDEADRLLATGPGSQLPDVETCLSVLPPPQERQTLLFTATVTPEVRALKAMPRSLGKQELFISEVDTQTLAIPTTLDQRYITVPVTQREAFLHVLLQTEGNKEKSVIIFVNRTATATYLEHVLRLLLHRVTALHSGLKQSERTSNLARFRARAARILIATDVASRGLDIPVVDVVMNYDLPRDPDDYIHRLGRTARAGKEGQGISFVGQRDVELVRAMERRVGREMQEWSEEGVSLEGRVVRGTTLKDVGQAKREALLRIEEGRDVKGRRKRGMEKLR